MKPGSLAQQKLLCVATALTFLILSLLTGYFLLHLTKHFESLHLQTPLFKQGKQELRQKLQNNFCIPSISDQRHYLSPTLYFNSVVILVISSSNYAIQKIPDGSLLSITPFAAGIITFFFLFAGLYTRRSLLITRRPQHCCGEIPCDEHLDVNGTHKEVFSVCCHLSDYPKCRAPP